MWEEWRNAYEVTGLRYRFKFAPLAPADYRLTFENIDDGLLYAVMMNCHLRFRFFKNKPPHSWRSETDFPAIAATRFEPRRLSSTTVKILGAPLCGCIRVNFIVWIA